MKMRNFACALFSLAFLFSCSDESLPNGEPTLNLQNMQKINNRIGVEEAINYVEEARALLEKEHPLDSRSIRAVNSVSALLFSDVKASAMKSGKYKDIEVSDTLAYIFNFGDSSGFVIVSNDKRIENPLFAFAKKGSLINGKTDNPGLILFLKRLEDYVLKSIIEFDKTDEQMVMAIAQRGGPTSVSLDTLLKPLVPVEWGQGMPFNNNVGGQCNNNTGNNKHWAGCVATATAQIMSYWEYPASIGNNTYNWTVLNKYKHKSDFVESPADNAAEKLRKKLLVLKVADLFEQIGIGVGMQYGCGSSGTSKANVLSSLVSNGFSSQSLWPYPYDSHSGLVRLKLILLYDKQPLMAIGCDANGAGCHAWVIDGLAQGSYDSNYYIHNNWGWDGNANGYYLSGVFDPSYNFQDVEIARVYR